MNFQPTEDQVMLANGVDRFARDLWVAADRPRLIAAAGREADDSRWRMMGELGWLALPIPEDAGGFGGSSSDIMALAEGLGHHLLPDPFVSVCVAAAPLLGTARRDLVETVIRGAARVVLALGDVGGGFDPLHIATTATPNRGGYVLDGAKDFVPDGADADWFVIPARTGGKIDKIDGISLFLLPRDVPGLEVARVRSPDNHRHARLRLSNVTVATDALIGTESAGGAALDAAVRRAMLAHCAEMVGAMDALRDITLDFLRTRRQFGQPIGAFQVLQHRMVDIATACEEARAITHRATLEAEAGVADGGRMISAAKARVGQVGLFVARQAVQLHGGVGATDELVVGHYLKRVMMLDLAYGNADHHRDRFAALQE